MDDPDGTDLRPVLVRMMDARVGSTLTMELLASSSSMALDRVYPFEHSYLTYLVRLVSQLAETEPIGDDFNGFVMDSLVYGKDDRVGPLPFEAAIVRPADLSRTGLAALWRTFSTAVNSQGPRRCSHYAEKYWGEVKPIIDAGLRPSIIDLVRDPRDVVASHRAFNRLHDEKLFGRPQATDEDSHLRHLAAAIAFRLNAMGAPLSVPRITVRYEDLVTKRADTCERIGELIGLSIRPDGAGGHGADTAAHMTSSSAEASIGRWRRDLDPADVRKIERRLAEPMVELGYDIDAPDTGA